MATAKQIYLSATEHPGHVHADAVSQETAHRVGELLMKNHEKFHILFNARGLHNHIVHHLLAIYALGATPDEVTKAYELNAPYQLPLRAHGSIIEEDLRDPQMFQKYIGQNRHYNGFLRFFMEEVTNRGVEGMLNEYLFKGDDRANDMLARLFDGLLHPLIHLGYGIEFGQPLIVAEALAQAAITELWLGDTCACVIERVEKQKPSLSLTDPTLVSLYSRLHEDPIISNAVRPGDPPNKLRDGLIARAKKDLIPYLAEYTVQPHQLEQKVAEQCRLVELKGWSDLITYAACKTPALYPERFLQYELKRPGGWESIFHRATCYNDDGHAAKFVRAIRNVEQVSKPFARQPGFDLGPEKCLTIAHMVMDSVERMNDPGYKLPQQATFVQGVNEEVLRIIFRWVRWNGIDEAWDHVPDCKESARL